MKIFAIKEDNKYELRVPITEDMFKKFDNLGLEVCYKKEQISESDIVVSINPLSPEIIESMKNGSISISIQRPHINKKNLELFQKKNITAYALDMIPRTTRAQYMDVLSSQSSLAGYRAVVEASHMLDRAFPMMMTTAGTIPAAKVLIIGAGVAGLQAIATAKRLGAVVSAFDVRSSAKEQVESLGAKFVEVTVDEKDKMDGVYATESSEQYKKAQAEKLKSVISSMDVVITTAQIPFKKAPVIIKKDSLDLMKSESIIIDLASETGGNCEITKHGETVIYNDKVKIVSFLNILNGIHHDASKLFSKNLYAFIELLLTNPEDDIIKATTLTKDGQILKEI
jgi:NAD(P) transhydrogenase subunit alpha